MIEAGETVIITRRGKEIAWLIPEPGVGHNRKLEDTPSMA
jgi:antitoxin (DNA-binding transcriptional repressor) of toxin-antitoxin stability system